MKGNPHFSDHLIDSPDERSVPAMVAALTYEQRTANLIAIYNTPNLVQYLSDADRIELEKTILKRAGLKDA